MKFSQVIGQEEVKIKLRHAFNEGRIAHAIMFLGPEGNGAFPLALAFAQYVSCPNRTEEDSCGTCPTCRKISSYQFADMYFTFPFFNKSDGGSEKTICDDYMKEWREQLNVNPYVGLDDWRDRLTKENKQLHISVYEAAKIIQNLTLKSFEGGHKFQFIWMAEFLKPDTANKLLKIIEEPPANTIFLLVANSAENILQTILSRVQTIHVPRIDDEHITAALVADNIPAAKAAEIAHFAHGDWNKALRYSRSDNPDEYFSQQFQTWMRMCYKKDMAWLLKWADEIHQLPREEQKHFLGYALDQIRQNLVLNYTGDEVVRMNRDEKDFSTKFSRFINDLNAEDLMEEISDAYSDIARNAYTKLVLTDLSVRVHYLLMRGQ
jgi:DNA polymerase-3 subunit delta'